MAWPPSLGNVGIVYLGASGYRPGDSKARGGKSLEYSIRIRADELTANQCAGNLGSACSSDKRHYDRAMEMHQKKLELALQRGNQQGAAANLQ